MADLIVIGFLAALVASGYLLVRLADALLPTEETR